MMSKNHQDSTGKYINIGDMVRFRGQNYTIAEFLDNGQGSCGTAQILFEEEQHTQEVASEISIDLIGGMNG